MEQILETARLSPVLQSQQVGPEGLGVRYLPPGRLSDLYSSYCAAQRARNLKPASTSVFRRAWRSGWDKALRFRKSSTHAMCHTCSRLQAVIRHARSLQEHVGACDKLMHHLERQWADRCIYWGLRARAQQSGDILVMILDAMDKSKFLLPRWAHGRAPKAALLERTRRPHLEVAASIVHGWGVFLWLADENMTTGGNFHSEMMVRSIEAVWTLSQEKGRPFPTDLSVHSDNTVAAIKNIVCSSVLAMLVSARYFRVAGHQHLRVGHSHEDIGSQGEFFLRCFVRFMVHGFQHEDRDRDQGSLSASGAIDV